MKVATATKAAGNKHFGAGKVATALHHYHSASFSLHGTCACQLVDNTGLPELTDAAYPVLDTLRAVRGA